jgi:AbrB family looped-hinge helix DNA binding protein
MASIHKAKVGKQGRIVLPKKLRQAYGVKTGDEAIIIANGNKLSIHLHQSQKDPLQDLTDLSKTISIGLSTPQLKKKINEERLKDFLKTQEG